MSFSFLHLSGVYKCPGFSAERPVPEADSKAHTLPTSSECTAPKYLLRSTVLEHLF